MIPYKVFPMFELGPLHFNLYGVMFALAFLTATFLAAIDAKKRGINKEVIYDLAFYILIGAIIGARLFYVIFYWPEHILFTFWDIFKVWEGGLAFFGGLLGALAAAYVYIRKNKLNFGIYVDIFTIPLIIGHILGRMGDYFTGGHPGKITNLPWAIYLDSALRHPVVLYEILGLVIIVLILYNLKKYKFFNGFLFSSYVILYSIQRMFLDFFRIELTDPRYLGLTPSQFLVVALFIIATYFMIIKFNRRKLKSNQWGGSKMDDEINNPENNSSERDLTRAQRKKLRRQKFKEEKKQSDAKQSIKRNFKSVGLITLGIILLSGLGFLIYSGTRVVMPTADDDPIIGNVDAPLTLIEFGDFKCPFTKQFNTGIMKDLFDKYGENINVVYRDMPTGKHGDARLPAMAAQCADDQGMFKEYHDLLFQNQQLSSKNDYKGLAQRLSLDMDNFEECLDSGKYKSEVRDDYKAGKDAGVMMTPTLYINNVPIHGIVEEDIYFRVIDEQLKLMEK